MSRGKSMAPYVSVREERHTEKCQHPVRYPDEPTGAYDYLGWHAWAEEKAKTHKQVRCEHCNLWAIWEPLT